MSAIRVRELLSQDRTTKRWIPIPPRVLAHYEAIGRPTPLIRARHLEDYLETPAKIFVKREDLLPTGSFKLNSSIAQAYYAREEAVPSLVTETGAGQWGHALAYACRMFGLRAVVFWADISSRQKVERGALLRMLGATVHPSPSSVTRVGRTLLKRRVVGSLGTAIGEAVSFAEDNPRYRYVSGSNHPHVLLHQSIIGLETRRQLERLGERPNTLIACVGGGSNLGGFVGPFLPDLLDGDLDVAVIGAESASAPRLTKGEWRYDHADPLGVTPLGKSYTLGHTYPLPETHVGGLRQHNGSPVIGVLRKHDVIEPVAYTEEQIFRAGQLFFRLEGVLPAPESCHALAAAIDRARDARASYRKENIVVCLSGSGLLDMRGYMAHARAIGI